ncbi:MAG: FKBP-type peptidyl-prolyl cis-trans isomerase [Deltaproteobacteria bacterium]|nr:FKBP-type peptidyl-prolyl cis-trans isomerase [Deltaproteobacteria bacterium]
MSNREVQSGDTVKVHYRGTLNDGSEFETTFGGEPLVFEVGSQDIIPGFSRAVLGMTRGEKKAVRLAVNEAYGPYRDNFVFQVGPDVFPEGTCPEAGQVFEMCNDQGKTLHVRVRDVGEDRIVLDANHRLAGQELNFEVELLEVVPK